MITRVIQMGASTSGEYFLDTVTGELILIPEDVLSAVENDEIDTLRPSQRALGEKAAEICMGSGRFAPVPHLSESDIFSVVSKLTAMLEDDDTAEAITEAMSSPDFADRFDEICISQPEVMDMFHDLLDQHTSELIDKWLKELAPRRISQSRKA
ncbi:MAG: hypothetical protein ACP5QG_08960 [candidate division WOR-3 bacterium]